MNNSREITKHEGISVIICSINESLCQSVQKNITQTIGVEFEIIVRENTTDSKGLSQVYNECAKEAKYPYLCFVHEDVIIHTENWGNILINDVQNQLTGVIGVAGTQSLSKHPYSWWSVDPSSNKINLIQRGKDGQMLNWKNNNLPALSEVLVLDGVFLFLKKSIWEEIQFDEINFPFFHYYDIDFTFAISGKYSNFVSSRILIEHLSIGKLNDDWFSAAFRFVEKWKLDLPRSLKSSPPLKSKNTKKKNIGYIRLMVLSTTWNIGTLYKKSKILDKENHSPILSLILILYFSVYKRLLRTYHLLRKLNN